MPSPGVNPRKRPAPGSAPATQQAQSIKPLSADSFLEDSPPGWGPSVSTGEASLDPQSAHCSKNIYGTGVGTSVDGMAKTPPPLTSTQLVRRSMGQQQMVSRGGVGVGGMTALQPEENDSWLDFNQDMQLELRPDGESRHDDDDNNDAVDLEQKAQSAKREALTKRKQIPPFVQKLSSFLDQSRNTDLIRWSDKGDSFIVLDEDEFARTLIPELFKHNNYASFVRQLNMYGFHKKVGLSDNSMRASERKNKNPSEYFNRYFRRGKPDLLWLINKPRNVKAPPASTTESFTQVTSSNASGGGAPIRGHKATSQGGKPRENSNDSAKVKTTNDPSATRAMVASEGDLSEVRQQLQAIQQQQRVISGAISRLRRDHNQIYEQAVAFQNLHDRHESSINAILTFLATVYNRSLNDHGTQNFASMFTNAIPPDENQGQQGNVVDVGEINHENLESSSTAARARNFRRPPLLLGAPPQQGQMDRYGRATTLSPAASGPATSPMATPRMVAASTPTSANPPSQTYTSQQPQQPQLSQQAVQQSQPSLEDFLTASHQAPFGQSAGALDLTLDPSSSEDIMSLINASNAQASPATELTASSMTNGAPSALDFPAALTHYQTANGATPLTPSERQDMLSMIARDTSLSSLNPPVSAPSATGTTINPPSNTADLGEPNAMPATAGASADTSFIHLPSLHAQTDELNRLARMQAEQNANVENLRSLIRPLSPLGGIPGFADDNANWLDGMGMDMGMGLGDGGVGAGVADLDRFFDSGGYFAGTNDEGIDGVGGGVDDLDALTGFESSNPNNLSKTPGELAADDDDGVRTVDHSEGGSATDRITASSADLSSAAAANTGNADRGSKRQKIMR